MKKTLNVFMIMLLCAVVLLLVSCTKREEISDPALKHPNWSDVNLEDIKPLRKILTVKYDLDELTEFFGNRGCHASCIHNEELLFFREVNERFPVEVDRPGGYCVYKVRQGGYFYVFWCHTVPLVPDAPTPMTGDGERAVYFTAYLRKEKKLSAFDSIKPGVSTAEDVRKMDPYLEMNFLMSSGDRSYSYLNEDEILRVTYEASGKVDGYEDLIVKSVEIIPRAPGRGSYGCILQQDLP